MIFYHLILLVTSLAILVWGADKFVDNSSLIAKKFGLSELTIGLTIIALGTSAPEIFVGISSIFNGTEALAMGTVIGSNISNIALIFGVSCIGVSMRPAKTNLVQFIPFAIAAIILGLVLLDLKINVIEGWVLLIIFALFIFITYKYRGSELDDQIEESATGTITILLYLTVGLLALIGGSNFAVIHAEKIAYILNVPQLIIGLTIIALGTSLPELAATISAIMKNKNDMVIGNVIGSNVMNIALVLPIIGFFSNTSFDSTLLSRDYFVMLIATILFVLLAATYSSNKINLKFIRFVGCIFVAGYIGYILNLSNLI